jgi:hypothetical protein
MAITIKRNANRGWTSCQGCGKNVSYDDVYQVVIGPDPLRKNAEIMLCGGCRQEAGMRLAPKRPPGRPRKVGL